MEIEDIKVADLKSAIKVLSVIEDNVEQHRAYFKEDALEQLIDYLENTLAKLRQEHQNG